MIEQGGDWERRNRLKAHDHTTSCCAKLLAAVVDLLHIVVIVLGGRCTKGFTTCRFGNSRRRPIFSWSRSPLSHRMRSGLAPLAVHTNCRDPDPLKVFSYNDFIFYTVLCAVVSLDRVDLREKVHSIPPCLSNTK